MIIPLDKINDIDYSFGLSVFQGKVDAEPENYWLSQIPDITRLVSASQVDKSFASNLEGLAKEIIEGSGSASQKTSQYIAQLAMMDWIDGSRQTLGIVAQSHPHTRSFE